MKQNRNPVGSQQTVRETVLYRDYDTPWITEGHRRFGNSLHAHHEIFIHVTRHILIERQSIAWSNGISSTDRGYWAPSMRVIPSSHASYFSSCGKNCNASILHTLIHTRNSLHSWRNEETGRSLQGFALACCCSQATKPWFYDKHTFICQLRRAC